LYRSDAEGLVGNSAWRVRGACAGESEVRVSFRGACAVESEERAPENPRQVSRRVAELANPLKMESAHCGRPDGGSGFEGEVEIESGGLQDRGVRRIGGSD